MSFLASLSLKQDIRIRELLKLHPALIFFIFSGFSLNFLTLELITTVNHNSAILVF